MITFLFLDVKKAPKKQTKNIMFVAHPDDETIFGGKEILENNYFIVCITNGNNPVRSHEFKQLLEKSNNQGVILTYPDMVQAKRANWKQERGKIKEDIKKYIEQKQWDKIVTHNPQGEYGHKHHQMTSQLVREVIKEEEKTERLYYFVPYFTKEGRRPSKTMNKREEQKLKQLATLYPSQKHTVGVYYHIFGYQDSISYQEWNEKYTKKQK